MSSTATTRNNSQRNLNTLLQCKFCSGYNHTINDCQDSVISDLCCAYMTYQYKPTTEFETYLRSISYQKFFAIAYYCVGYRENEIHPTTKKTILHRILELHAITKNTQRMENMSLLGSGPNSVVINSRKDRINLQHTIEGFQIDIMQKMQPNQIRDTLYLLSRGHNLEQQFSTANEEILRESAVEGLVSLGGQPASSIGEMTVEQILQVNSIRWTNRSVNCENIECPICYMNIRTNICEYNCNHKFCLNCTCRTLRTGNTNCSLCRTNIHNIVNYQGRNHK